VNFQTEALLCTLILNGVGKFKEDRLNVKMSAIEEQVLHVFKEKNTLIPFKNIFENRKKQNLIIPLRRFIASLHVNRLSGTTRLLGFADSDLRPLFAINSLTCFSLPLVLLFYCMNSCHNPFALSTFTAFVSLDCGNSKRGNEDRVIFML